MTSLIQMIRDNVYTARSDVTCFFGGEAVVFYADEGSAQVFTDKQHVFSTWEELENTPVFWGKTLASVADCLVLDE